MASLKDKEKHNKYMSDYYKKPENRAKKNAFNRKYATKYPKRVKEYAEKFLAKTPTARVNYRLKARYGITLEEYDVILGLQSGVCKICGGINENGWRLAVDHDHKTGVVRGLLCNGCNRKLGWFEVLEDNIKNYLKG